MKTTTLYWLQSTRAALLGSLFSFGIAACGSPAEPIGESQQSISAGDSDASEGEAAPACADGVAPADAVASECQVTARGRCFASAEAACACAGCGSDECALAESFPAQAVCPAAAGGSDPNGSSSSDPNTPVSSEPSGGGSAGHAGGGAPPDQPGCAASGQTEPAEPTAPACAGGVARDATSEQRCDFVVGGACFNDADSACACAGCPAGECLILESYPAQVACAS